MKFEVISDVFMIGVNYILVYLAYGTNMRRQEVPDYGWTINRFKGNTTINIWPVFSLCPNYYIFHS